MPLAIAELPFHERPIDELLNFDEDRVEVDRDYAGYGWARIDRIALVGHAQVVEVADALVLALHSADDGEPFADDVELELELPDRPSVAVLLSKFLEVWLPKLPRASAIVLALCNPYRAQLRGAGTTPLHYPSGDAESRRYEREDGTSEIELVAETWYTVTS